MSQPGGGPGQPNAASGQATTASSPPAVASQPPLLNGSGSPSSPTPAQNGAGTPPRPTPWWRHPWQTATWIDARLKEVSTVASWIFRVGTILFSLIVGSVLGFAGHDVVAGASGPTVYVTPDLPDGPQVPPDSSTTAAFQRTISVGESDIRCIASDAGPFSHVALAPDHSRAMSYEVGVVVLMPPDCSGQDQVKKAVGLDGTVSALTFSGDGRQLFVGTTGGTLHRFDVSALRAADIDVTTSPDSDTVLVPDTTPDVTGPEIVDVVVTDDQTIYFSQDDKVFQIDAPGVTHQVMTTPHAFKKVTTAGTGELTVIAASDDNGNVFAYRPSDKAALDLDIGCRVSALGGSANHLYVAGTSYNTNKSCFEVLDMRKPNMPHQGESQGNLNELRNRPEKAYDIAATSGRGEVAVIMSTVTGGGSVMRLWDPESGAGTFDPEDVRPAAPGKVALSSDADTFATVRGGFLQVRRVVVTP